jgi:hypothetical protein
VIKDIMPAQKTAFNLQGSKAFCLSFPSKWGKIIMKRMDLFIRPMYGEKNKCIHYEHCG